MAKFKEQLMGFETGKAYISASDLKNYPLWKYNDEGDLLYPVLSVKDLPNDSFDLIVRAKFTTSNGIKLFGYIVGVRSIFSIAVYLNNQRYGFNKNLLDRCAENIRKLRMILKHDIDMSDFSPLKFTTDISIEGFSNIDGEFDLLKKQTNEEKLGDLWTGD